MFLWIKSVEKLSHHWYICSINHLKNIVSSDFGEFFHSIFSEEKAGSEEEEEILESFNGSVCVFFS